MLIIIVLLLVFGLPGGWYANRTWGSRGGFGVGGLIILILVLFWLFGGLGASFGHRF
jgi:hypothetical protein